MIELINGRAERLPFRDGIFHCIITSPPYWRLRNYGVKGQIGQEESLEDYVLKMVLVCRELRRVLREDGVLWLNIGDTYAVGNISQGRGPNSGVGDVSHIEGGARRIAGDGLKPKDMCGVPWAVAAALRDDGWYLRSEVIWFKLNPTPEPVKDRPTKSHEQVFLLTKSQNYFYDWFAVKEESTQHPSQLKRKSVKRGGFRSKNRARGKESSRFVAPSRNRRDVWEYFEEWQKKDCPECGGMEERVEDCVVCGGSGFVWIYYWKEDSAGRSVWKMATESYKGAHFATYPQKLVEPCVGAGTSEAGVCPECGNQWERIVETEYTEGGGGGPSGMIGTMEGMTKMMVKRKTRHDKTVGFRPSCDHYDSLYEMNFWLPRKERKRKQRLISGDWLRRVKKHPPPDWWPTEKAIVFDPFVGSGTTLQVARKMGVSAVGCDLSVEYLKLAEKRINGKKVLRVLEDENVFSGLPLFEGMEENER